MVESVEIQKMLNLYPVGNIPEKAVSRSVFLTIWHCILSAKLIKALSFFFGDFAHWVIFGIFHPELLQNQF